MFSTQIFYLNKVLRKNNKTSNSNRSVKLGISVIRK